MPRSNDQHCGLVGLSVLFIDGDIDLEDPWIAVVPEAYLPVPTVTGTQSMHALTGYFGFFRMEHLYSQALLQNRTGV